MREKKVFEASLPPTTDEASLAIRKKLLEARELKEWALREAEMKKEQQDKLQILIETLRARENGREDLSEARVELIRKQKMQDRDEALDVINVRRIKQVRQLKNSRPHLEPQSNKRDIIKEHANFGSKVYAPKARNGRLPVQNQVVDYGIPLIANYQGLTALENTLPTKTFEVAIKEPEHIVPKSSVGRKAQAIEADLDFLDRLIEERKLDKKAAVVVNVYKKFEPVVRPPMPSVVAPPKEDAHNAALLLQRLLRGRAIQNTMYEGKQKALNLIRELRIAEEPMSSEDVEAKEAELFHVTMDTMAGEVVASTLDFVSKEIVRMFEEQKIADMVRGANATRRQREAVEAGRRQAEDALRKKREQHYTAVMAVHSSTADRFLDEVFEVSAKAVAAKQATVEASINARVLGDITSELEDKDNGADQVAQDLVKALVLPEVERLVEVRKDQVESRRFEDAATFAAQVVVQEVASRSASNSRPSTRQKSRPSTSS
jgi:hypothetical protein